MVGYAAQQPQVQAWVERGAFVGVAVLLRCGVKLNDALLAAMCLSAVDLVWLVIFVSVQSCFAH
jgi:hypothetical protein